MRNGFFLSVLLRYILFEPHFIRKNSSPATVQSDSITLRKSLTSVSSPLRIRMRSGSSAIEFMLPGILRRRLLVQWVSTDRREMCGLRTPHHGNGEPGSDLEEENFLMFGQGYERRTCRVFKLLSSWIVVLLLFISILCAGRP